MERRGGRYRRRPRGGYRYQGHGRTQETPTVTAAAPINPELICTLHKGRPKEFMCLEPYDMRPFCAKCKGDHNNHKTILLSEFFQILEEFHRVLSGKWKRTQDAAAQFRGARDTLEETTGRLELLLAKMWEQLGDPKIPKADMRPRLQSSVRYLNKMREVYERRIKTMENRVKLIGDPTRAAKFSDVINAYISEVDYVARIKAKTEKETGPLQTMAEIAGKFAGYVQKLVADSEATPISPEDDWAASIFYHIIQTADLEYYKRINDCARNFLGIERTKEKKEPLEEVYFIKCDRWMRYYSDGPSVRRGLAHNFLLMREYTHMFSYVVVKHVVYFSGGGTPTPRNDTGAFYLFGPDVGRVHEKAFMLYAKYYHSLVFARGNRIYSVGGIGDTTRPTPKRFCECYYIEQNRWREVAPLNNEISEGFVLNVDDRYLYAFRGLNKNVAMHFEIYDLIDPEDGWTMHVCEKDPKSLWTDFHAVIPVRTSMTDVLLFSYHKRDPASKKKIIRYNLTTDTLMPYYTGWSSQDPQKDFPFQKPLCHNHRIYFNLDYSNATHYFNTWDMTWNYCTVPRMVLQ